VTGALFGLIFAKEVIDMKEVNKLHVKGDLTVDGNIGIGTESPNHKLEVAGNIGYEQLTGLEVADNFAANVRCADFRIGHSTRRRSLGRALVDYGDTLVINYGFDWRGGVRHYGPISEVSSRELKEGIADLSSEEALVALDGLHPVKFNLKADKRKTLLLGFVAEDAPDLISSRDKKAITNGHIIAVLTKVVKEQQKAISALNEKVRKLG